MPKVLKSYLQSLTHASAMMHMSQDHRGEYQRYLDDFAFPILETQLFDDLFFEFSPSQNIRTVPPPPADSDTRTLPDPHHFPHLDGPYDSPMSHASYLADVFCV
jgi:hypothetical protein